MTTYNEKPDIMNVKEIIEATFGPLEKNCVNFKLLQTIIFLLARQLRLLERRVDVEFGSIKDIQPSASTLSVTEVKIHAKKAKKSKGEGGAKAGGIGKKKAQKTGKETSSSEKTSTDKSSSDKTSTEKTSSDKTSTEKTLSDKTSTDKTSTDKTSSDKTSSDKISTEKTMSTDKTSSDKTSSDKTSTEKTTSTDKTSSDKTSSDKTSTEKTMSTDKTSSDKTSSDKTSTEKTTSTDKSSTDKTTSSYKSSTDKTSTDKTSTDKTSTDKISSDKTSSDKTSGDKTSTDLYSPDITSTDKTSTDKTYTSKTTSSSKDGGEKGKTAKEQVASTISCNTWEEQKERVLRVIHQREDSFEMRTKTPTPMASAASIEQHEIILVVERVPSGTKVGGRTPQISVVTQEQFENLINIVRQLQNRLLPVDTPGFPERVELMEELRRGASLTDAMAALQLSARLEATEKAIGRLIPMIVEIAKQTPGVEVDDTPFIPGVVQGSGTGSESVGTDWESSQRKGGKRGGSHKTSPGASKSSGALKSPEGHKTPAYTTPKSQDLVTIASVDETSEISPTMPHIKTSDDAATVEDTFSMKPEYITRDMLDAATQEIYDGLLQSLTSVTTRATLSANNAQKLALSLEGKIEAALNVSSRMTDLESFVQQYAEQINALDSGLSSQMTNYQEQLTQMQHDLEIGLENMAEVLANAGGDTVAVAELNSHFTNLQTDFDNMLYQQKDLKDNVNSVAYDLESLWSQIEMLRECKSDREEVADALRDKAGIGQLNGLVGIQQFEAVQGDFEQRISFAYDKFNNQELVWQKAIDELVRELNEKADIIQVESLRDEINKYLNIMRGRVQQLVDIVGEPKSAMLSKKLFRDTVCLSCGSPAHMDGEEVTLFPEFPKFRLSQQVGKEAESKTKGDGDPRDGICYHGLPLPHPRDPRSHVCQRYCGGSHTLMNEGPKRIPPSMTINVAFRQVSLEPGTDGKMYKVQEEPSKVPCLPCNKPKHPTLQPKKKHIAKVRDSTDSALPAGSEMTVNIRSISTSGNNVPVNVNNVNANESEIVSKDAQGAGNGKIIPMTPPTKEDIS